MDTSIYETLCLVEKSEMRNCKCETNGLKYSYDGKKLLKCEGDLAIYRIKEGVEIICKGAFRSNKKVKSVVIPNSVKYIGCGAFQGCTSLNSVSFPSEIVYIGKDGFNNTSIMEVNLSQSLVEKIEPRTFRFCKKLKSVFFPNRLNFIGENAFSGSGLELIDLSKTEVTEIKTGAFAATYAKTVLLPKCLRSVEDCAFAFTRIKDIDIPDNVEFLGEFAFASQNLENAVLPKGLKEIRPAAISRNGGGEIKLSSNSTDFIVTDKAIYNKNKTTLYYCFSEEYKIPASVKEIRPNGFKYSGKITFDENSKIEKINDDAFNGANYISQTLPNTVKSIGNRAFSRNGFSSFKLPDNVETIGDEAFMGCWCLEEVYIPDSVKSIGKDVFENCPALENIKVPVGANDLIKALLSQYQEYVSEEIPTESINDENNENFLDEINNETNNAEIGIDGGDSISQIDAEEIQFEIISDITTQLTGLEISNIKVSVINEYKLEFNFDVEGKIKENFLLSVAFYDKANNIRETKSIHYFNNNEKGYKRSFSKHFTTNVYLNKCYMVYKRIRLYLG